jgi:hypothetical protein
MCAPASPPALPPLQDDETPPERWGGRLLDLGSAWSEVIVTRSASQHGAQHRSALPWSGAGGQ